MENKRKYKPKPSIETPQFYVIQNLWFLFHSLES